MNLVYNVGCQWMRRIFLVDFRCPPFFFYVFQCKPFLSLFIFLVRGFWEFWYLTMFLKSFVILSLLYLNSSYLFLDTVVHSFRFHVKFELTTGKSMFRFREQRFSPFMYENEISDFIISELFIIVSVRYKSLSLSKTQNQQPTP